jgi:hypothetical protein
MKYTELLEKVDFEFNSPYDSSQSVKVFRNPNYAEATQARNKSSFQELRGLVVGDNVVYVWDANLATHDDVIQLIKPLPTVMRFIIGTQGELLSADSTTTAEELSALPMVKRMVDPPVARNLHT